MSCWKASKLGKFQKWKRLYVDRPSVRGDAVGNHNELRCTMGRPKRDFKKSCAEWKFPWQLPWSCG